MIGLGAIVVIGGALFLEIDGKLIPQNVWNLGIFDVLDLDLVPQFINGYPSQQQGITALNSFLSTLYNQGWPAIGGNVAGNYYRLDPTFTQVEMGTGASMSNQNSWEGDGATVIRFLDYPVPIGCFCANGSTYSNNWCANNGCGGNTCKSADNVANAFVNFFQSQATSWNCPFMPTVVQWEIFNGGPQFDARSILQSNGVSLYQSILGWLQTYNQI